MSLLYLDTSAFLKLFVQEPASQLVLELCIANQGNLVSSDLLLAETIGTLNSRDLDVSHAKEALGTVHLMPIRRDILNKAADLSRYGLRTLDGIHLATALSVKSHLKALVTYDRKLGKVALEMGLRVIEPGKE